MKSQVLYTVWCNISGEAAGEVWFWSLLGVKGSNVVFHMRRIECKLAKRIVFAHLHSIRRMWNTTFEPELVYGYEGSAIEITGCSQWSHSEARIHNLLHLFLNSTFRNEIQLERGLSRASTELKRVSTELLATQRAYESPIRGEMYIEHSNITQESLVSPLNVSWTFSPFAKSTGEWPKNTKTNMKQREKWPNTCVSTRVIPVQSLLERSNLTVVIDKSDVSSVIQQDGRDFGVTSVGLGTRQEQDVRTWVEPISDIIIQNGADLERRKISISPACEKQVTGIASSPRNPQD